MILTSLLTQPLLIMPLIFGRTLKARNLQTALASAKQKSTNHSLFIL